MSGNDARSTAKEARMSAGQPDTPLAYLAHFLSQIKTEAASVSVPESMRTLINQSLELASGLRTYPSAMSTELSHDAKVLDEMTTDLDYDGMYNEGRTGDIKFYREYSSNILQGKVLKMLVRMTGAKRILEIGTFTGFAALNMAEALPSDGHLVTIEVMPFFVQFARDFFAKTIHKEKIEVHEGPAIEILKILGEKNQQFDFIFVDATKDEYKEYFSLILDLNILAPKGSLLFDNTISRGACFMKSFPQPDHAKGGRIIHDFNQFVMNEPRVEQVILPIRDGVSIIRRLDE